MLVLELDLHPQGWFLLSLLGGTLQVKTHDGMNSLRFRYKLHILYTRVWRHEISCRHNFMSVLRTGMKFYAGLKNMCNHQFLFHAGMKEKNRHIMSQKYDSQSVFVI